MVNIEQEKPNEAGQLLLEIKCLARLGVLASESCVDDNKLQLQDNLEYSSVLSQITNLVIKVLREWKLRCPHNAMNLIV